MKITFWGATSDVTGSMTFIENEEGLLMVDCGLAQGTPEAEKLNLLPLPFSPKDIKAVLITHAHLDHTGYLPKLFKDGFKGKVFCTRPTLKLMRIILEDSAKLDDSDFYSLEDVSHVISQAQPIEWHREMHIHGLDVTFLPAGHILGASSVLVRSQEKSILFSGDLGRNDDILMPPPPSCPPVDMVVMESTYGGRVRHGDMTEEMTSFLRKLKEGSRVGLVASFSVARGQNLLSLVNDIFQKHPELKVRVVMDSPMMEKANQVYAQFSSLTKKGQDFNEALERREFLEHQRQRESLEKTNGPLLIISSSGMLTGGKIWTHLRTWQHDSSAILFLPGYQGVDTQGRAISEGKRNLRGPDGEEIFWQGEVLTSEAFSSHADQNELLAWVKTSGAAQVFLIHGEQEMKLKLAEKLRDGFQVKIPIRGEHA